MTRSAQPYLALIQRALTQIERYRPPTSGEFLEQQMAQDAILMRLQEIGENLSRIRRLDEETFSTSSPDSWRHLIGLRNIISHGYHAVDP